MGKPACRRHTLARATAAHAHCMHHARRGRSSCWGVARHPLAPVFLRVRRLRLQSCSIHTISDLGLDFLCSSGLGSRLAAQPTLRDDRKAVHDSRLLRLGPGTSNCGDTPACDARELCNLVPCRKRNTPVVSRITHHTTAIHRSLPVACSRQRAHVLEHSLCTDNETFEFAHTRGLLCSPVLAGGVWGRREEWLGARFVCPSRTVAINCRRCARRRHVRVDRLKVQLISAKLRPKSRAWGRGSQHTSATRDDGGGSRGAMGDFHTAKQPQTPRRRLGTQPAPKDRTAPRAPPLVQPRMQPAVALLLLACFDAGRYHAPALALAPSPHAVSGLLARGCGWSPAW